MILDFKGPFHFEHLDSLKDFANKPGIYIWGFIYEYQNMELTDPADYSKAKSIPAYSEPGCKLNDNQLFLPYYVGLDNKLFQRISNHFYVREGNSRFYKRFSLSYMKKFFNDLGFQPTITSDNKNCKDSSVKQGCAGCKNSQLIENKSLDYINIENCLKKIYGAHGIHNINGNCPINIQFQSNNKEIPDTLDFIVNKLNNFWFCYGIPDDKKANLKDLETYVYYSLKGKTISLTTKPKEINNIEIVPTDQCKDIFSSLNGKNNEFKGYFK